MAILSNITVKKALFTIVLADINNIKNTKISVV